MNLKELIQKEKEFEESQPISYFLKEIKETLEYAKEDGFDLQDLSKALRNFNNDISELIRAYNHYYENNRIKEEYKSICGYLCCIGKYIRVIESKLS